MKSLFSRMLIVVIVSTSMLSNVVAAEKVKPQTRTYISEHCLLSENKPDKSAGLFALFLAALVPKAINWTIDFAVKKLAKIQKDESTSTNRFYLYTFDSGANKFPVWNKNFSCMTSITAVFAKDALTGGLEPLETYDYKTDVDLTKDATANNLLQRLKDNEITFKEHGLYSMYETKFEFAEDASAYKIVSKYLQVNRLLSGKSKAGQVYSFRINGPGSSPDGATYSLATVDLGEVTPGKRKTESTFKKGKSTGWIRRTGMSANSLWAFISERPAAQGRSITRQYTPVKLSISNIQTIKPSDSAKLVATVLSALKETISSSVTKAVVPKDKAAEEAKMLDARIAVAEARTALEAAAAGSAAAHFAQLKLDKACIALTNLGAKTCP